MEGVSAVAFQSECSAEFLMFVDIVVVVVDSNDVNNLSIIFVHHIKLSIIQ